MSEAEKDPIKIDEVLEINFKGSIKGSESVDFKAVVFPNIPESFPVDAHIECRYTVTSEIIPTTRDWVGLYKVGWMTPREYIYYEWAPLPKDYELGKPAESSVLFQAHNLPDDDGDFYQFCYVASSNQIRGASTPFQFRKPSSQDYVEVEDPETDMLVIRSKTTYLQENLVKAEEERTKLMEVKVGLQAERDDLAAKYADVKKKLAQAEQNGDVLKNRVKSTETQIGQLHREARDMMVVHDELRDSLDSIKKEKAELDKQIVKLNKEIDGLNAELKKIQAERDQLAGEKHSLQQEVILYKEHFTSSESSASKYSEQLEQQQVCLAEKDSLIDHLQKAVNDLRVQAEADKEYLEKQVALQGAKEEEIEGLSEQLKNAEDKLRAADERRTILQVELHSYQESQAELNSLVERTKSECHMLKEKLNQLEIDFQRKSEVQESELDQAKLDLLSSTQEKNKLQMENSQLRDQVSMTLEETDLRDGSRSCMKQALQQLKERLAKKDKQCCTLEKALKQREAEFQEREHELKREVEDLKERIFMCGEEYKAQMARNAKLQRRYDKAVANRKIRSRENSTSSLVQVEKLQTSGAPSDQDGESLSELQGKDLEQSLMALDEKLAQQQEKKRKYKRLYLEERERTDSVRAKLQEELKARESEIAELKEAIEDTPSRQDAKIFALEKLLAEKERTIDELNTKLCATNNRLEEKSGDTDTVDGVQSRYTVLQYGNPYLSKPTGYAYPNPNPTPYMFYPDAAQMQYPVTPHPIMQMPRTAIPPPPLRYPGHALPPEFPVTRQPERRSASPSSPSPLDSDVENKEEITLSEPLTPLPAPLQPQRTIRGWDAENLDDMDGLPQEFQQLVVNLDKSSPSAPPAPGDLREERFQDAMGDPMKFCRHCDKSFSADIPEDIIAAHELTHVEGICPICNMMKSEDMSEEDFVRHVNKHLEDEEQNEPHPGFDNFSC